MAIEISEETALDLLLNELDKWNMDRDVYDLFADYYEANISCFDGERDFQPMFIVDNDYINNTSHGTKEELMKSHGWEIGNEFDEEQFEDRVLHHYGNLYLISSY